MSLRRTQVPHCIMVWCLSLFLLLGCTDDESQLIEIQDGSSIVMVGNNLCSRMINFGHFETELYLRYPQNDLKVRNMCDGGNTPGFRPHSGRNSPWAFSGANDYQDEFANNSRSQGHLATEDEWLTDMAADVVIAFFGFNEAQFGSEGLDLFQAELEAFVEHTHVQRYNGVTAPQLVLVSPTAYEDLSESADLPDGKAENEVLALYTQAMRETALKFNIKFVDAFQASDRWYAKHPPLTIDGLQLNDAGYALLGEFLADEVLGESDGTAIANEDAVHSAVMDKNWFWHNEYKIPNGVHVFGRRYDPFGPDNYPAELKKLRQMTEIRDTAIWSIAKGEEYDVAAADSRTHVLPAVESNYDVPDPDNPPRYLYGEEALSTIEMAPGYKIELFASEQEFPDLANPVQLSFDNIGRLWVAVMPSYPHYKPGDSKPDDKLLILEDTDGDGKADKQTIFADGLHLPIGFEFAPEGVYVSQGTNLKLLTDTDGDDRADREEIIFSGFDDHDTHHAISAFCADPSGAIYMAEGVFLHTNVETPYGTVRATNGGFYRFNPQRRHLERTSQVSIPNPWGIAFDEWGQNFFAETSGPDVLWMMPGSIRPRYGDASPKGRNLIEDKHRVRPTSGLEFVWSRHFPDNTQGDLLINNTIGFLGTKQHVLEDDGTGYKSHHHLDLIKSSDPNFRPVDMEIAPDGSLYLIDWHNVLIGHMQHNARDPLRDHVHGRVYRVTYPSRPLVTPAKIVDASVPELLNNLKLPEYRTRYRTRRELRSRDKEEVLQQLSIWVDALDPSDGRYEHQLLEALWVTWGLNALDKDLLEQALTALDHRVRAAAVKVLRYNTQGIANANELLSVAAADEHGRVRLEALVAASWLDKESALEVLQIAGSKPMDSWMEAPYKTAVAHVNGESFVEEKNEETGTNLTGEALELYTQGKEIYEREGFCGTCHQDDGKGLFASGYPPLANTDWVNGSEERLIKLTLHGMYGPVVVAGKKYEGTVPMTPFGGMLNNDEVAAVLTYVRNAFGNSSDPVSSVTVSTVRLATESKKGFYTAEELK